MRRSNFVCRCGGTKLQAWHLVCPTCWDKVPKALQDEVFDAYKKVPGSPRHNAAVCQVLDLLGPIKRNEAEKHW